MWDYATLNLFVFERLKVIVRLTNCYTITHFSSFNKGERGQEREREREIGWERESEREREG